MNAAARKKGLWILLAGLAAVFWAPPASGQYRSEYGDIRQTVARISSVTGDASFARGDDPENWQPADRNVPMTLGDRVYTGGRSRLELQVHGGSFIRIGGRTDLAALNLTDDTKQFSLKSGIASFQVRRLGYDEIYEVDTPNAAVTFERPGEYRVDVDFDGNTRVIVRRGQAMAAAGGGQIPLRGGDEMDIDGIDSPRYEVLAMDRPDGWDQWVTEREYRVARARSARYISADIVGWDDLDEYGRWEQIPGYGSCWTPTVVTADWVPYRVGHWIWQDPWGWTWVSGEPWGWAPYHYGRWTVYSSRWYWVPVAPSVRYVSYSPALVAFVGGGPGWSASVRIGGGGVRFGTGVSAVGWFPLGPRDPAISWWEPRASVRVDVARATFVNRTYVTVVNQNTFVSGGIVTNNIVRDREVVREIAAAPVASGPIPAVPTRASLHVAVRSDLPAPPRPPAQVVERAVVAHVAPPPAPPTFQSKVSVIEQNHGAPVAPAAAARMSVESHGNARAVTEVHPVAPEGGQVTLAPRGRTEAAPAAQHPEPVAPIRGRPMATSQQPVAASPVTGATHPSAGPPPREVAAPQSPPPAQPERGRPERAAPPAPHAPEPTAVPPPQERFRGRPERVAPPPPPPPEATAVPPPPPPQQERLRGRPERAAPPPPPPPEATAPPPPPQQERLRGRPERAAPPPPPPPEATAVPPPPQQERLRGRPERAAPPPPPPPQATAPPPPPQQERLRGRPERPAPPQATPTKTDEQKKDEKDKKKDEKQEQRERKPD